MYLLGSSDARVDGLPGPDTGEDAWVAFVDPCRVKNAKCGDKGDWGKCKSDEPTARKLRGSGDVTVNTSEEVRVADTDTGDTGTADRWPGGTDARSATTWERSDCNIVGALKTVMAGVSSVSGSGSSSSKSSSTCSNCGGAGEMGDGDGAVTSGRVGGGDTNETDSAATTRIDGADRTSVDAVSEVALISVASLTVTLPPRKVTAALCVVTGAEGYTAERSDTRALTGRVGLGVGRVAVGTVPRALTAVAVVDAAVAGGITLVAA
jgi:hypothetical protein